MAQQGFRREDHQRLAEWSNHLTTQHVEDLCAVGRLNDLHVVVGAQLEETLDAGRRVLGALAFVAVRQHQRQARSEEHTSELQSLMRISYAVFCLKKKKEREQC